MDLSTLSNEDLLALRSGNISNVSNAGLMALKPPAKVEKKESAARTALDQTLQGATFGFGDEISDAIGAGIAGIALRRNPVDLYKENRQETVNRLKRQFEQRPRLSIGANVAGGLLTGGAGATTKAGATVGNILRSGNAAARVGKGALAGAASGGIYGLGVGEGEDRLRSAGQGAIFGGAAGGAIPAVGAAGAGLASALVPQIDDAMKPLVKRAKEFGIPLRADQVAPSQMRATAQKISQSIPGSGNQPFEEAQRKAFAKAVASTIGEESEDLGPETIKRFRKRNSNVFEKLVGNRKIEIDLNDVQRISGLRNKVDDTLGITDRDARILRKEIEGVVSDLTDGPIAGKKLASIRSDLLKKSTSSRAGSPIFSDLLEELDEITKKSLTPQGVSELQKARKEYRNFKTLEKIIEFDGSINPTKLLSKIQSNKYISHADKVLGEDDIVDLARIGKALVRQGGSDTFEKGVLFGGGGGIATAAAVNPMIAIPLAAKAGIGVLANRGIQKGVFQNQKLIEKALSSPVYKPLLNDVSGRAGLLGSITANR